MTRPPTAPYQPIAVTHGALVRAFHLPPHPGQDCDRPLRFLGTSCEPTTINVEKSLDTVIVTRYCPFCDEVLITDGDKLTHYPLATACRGRWDR